MPTTEARPPGEQPGRSLTTSVDELAAASIVHVAGEIDLSTVGELDAAIELAETRSVNTSGLAGLIVIDLRGVTFLGAEGLRSLVSAQDRIAGEGGAMRVVSPAGGGIIRRLLDLSGVGALLDLFESVESAVPASSNT